jgi:hypothetical protein
MADGQTVAKIKSSTPLPEGRYGKMGLGMGLFGLVTDTYFNLKQGDSFGKAVIKGIGSGIAWGVMPGVMWAGVGASMIPGIVKGIDSLNDRMAQDYNNMITPGTNFVYRDSRAALTMRQAAVQAIQGSKLNARNALGGEAALMHRGYKR